MSNRALKELSEESDKIHVPVGRPSSPLVKPVGSFLLPGSVPDPKRPDAYGQVGSAFISMICWAVCARRGNGPFDLFQELREAFGGDDRGNLFGKITEQMRERGLLSDEDLTVDRKLIEAWAFQRSFQLKGREAKGLGRL